MTILFLSCFDGMINAFIYLDLATKRIARLYWTRYCSAHSCKVHESADSGFVRIGAGFVLM